MNARSRSPFLISLSLATASFVVNACDSPSIVAEFRDAALTLTPPTTDDGAIDGGFDASTVADVLPDLPSFGEAGAGGDTGPVGSPPADALAEGEAAIDAGADAATEADADAATD